MDYPGIDAVKRIAESRCAAGFHTNLIPESKRKDLNNFRALVRPRTSGAESRSSTKTCSRAVSCVLTKSGNG